MQKSGPGYDLPIAIALLVASNQIPDNYKNTILWGELSLGGKLRRGYGALLIAETARKFGFKKIVVPLENAQEVAIIKGIDCFSAKSLTESLKPKVIKKTDINYVTSNNKVSKEYNFSQITGQKRAKRALEIAAVGEHNVLFSGVPGSGKTLLARSFPGILDELNYKEKLEVTRIHSIAGKLNINEGIVTKRPFRSPHHSSSHVALVGGGAKLNPGEVTLAHKGVLFLDECTEFENRTMEALRQPLEDRFVTISRATGTVRYPADFILIGAMNPCKCGYAGDKDKQCSCTLFDKQRYAKRLSGPILDRIDMQLYIERVSVKDLRNKVLEEDSSIVKSRVVKAREFMLFRKNKNTNSKEENMELQARKLIFKAVDNLRLSARAYFKICKISRSIADLEQEYIIRKKHVVEALSLRSLG